MAVLAVVCALALYMLYSSAEAGGTAVYGFWSADSSFLEKAGLKSMFITISPENKSLDEPIGFTYQTCPAYVLIKDASSTLVNTSTKLSIKRLPSAASSIIKFRLKFDKSIDPLPQLLDAELNPGLGLIVLSANKKMFGRLFKRTETSFFCSAQPSLRADDSEEKKETPDSGASAEVEDSDSLD